MPAMHDEAEVNRLHKTATMSVALCPDRTNLLKAHWLAIFHQEYVLAQQPAKPGSPLYGSATNTAVHWLLSVARFGRLTEMARGLFIGGVGQCLAHPSGSTAFPVEVRNGKVHFFQNAMPWQHYGEAFTLTWFGALAFSALAKAEIEMYSWSALPKDTIGCRKDFLDFFAAYVRGPSWLIEPFYNRYGKWQTQQRLDVLNEFFRTLPDRALRVRNYTYP